MSETHLLTVIAQEYAKLSSTVRSGKIKKLVTKLNTNREFVPKHYPDFFEEASPCNFPR